MGCTFCASTLAGFKRNLMPSELESQIHIAQRDLAIRISHIVLMGIGEPLDNYENVIKFLKTVNDDRGLNISLRDVTLSTCGVVPKIYDLMNEGMPITLTLSLHAPNDRLRSGMMPVNNKWGVDEAIKACRAYAEKTGRRVSSEKDIKNFRDILCSLGINATIRRTLGSDINASCGQLRRKKKDGDTDENCC